jgi:hypothetical protein
LCYLGLGKVLCALNFVRMIAQEIKNGDTHCLGAARPILLGNGRNSKAELLNRYRGKDCGCQNFGGAFSSYYTSPNLVSRSLLPHVFLAQLVRKVSRQTLKSYFIIFGPNKVLHQDLEQKVPTWRHVNPAKPPKPPLTASQRVRSSNGAHMIRTRWTC